MLEEMHKKTLANVISFLKKTSQLKKTKRSGWVRVGIKSPESVADHTFRTAILCMIFSNLEGLDELKMLQMALIHDLPETVIGDLMPSEKIKADKKIEENAMKTLLSLLPKHVQDRYLQVWHEYDKGKTEEAKAVRQLEKLEMALQAKEYKDDKVAEESLDEFIKSADKSIYSASVRALFTCT
jgi:putative hydrolase of HD superfamily